MTIIIIIELYSDEIHGFFFYLNYILRAFYANHLEPLPSIRTPPLKLHIVPIKLYKTLPSAGVAREREEKRKNR